MYSGRLRSVSWSDKTKELAFCCLALIGTTATGMAAPGDNGEEAFTAKERAHWAFQKIANPKPPKVEQADWVRNSIDAFVLAELETKRLGPAPSADKITLIRRATFDLIGLPPTTEAVDAFLADDSSKAFDKVVDRLLASPRYGERWARHWLDLARYAESEGFKADDIPLLGEKELQRHREQLARWEEKTRAIRAEMEAIAEPHRRAIIKDYVDKYPPEIQDALNKTPEERTPIQWQMVHKANQYLEPGSYQYIAADSAVEGRLKGDQRSRWQELKDELKRFASLKPVDLPIGTGITDVAPAPPETRVLRRGVYDAPKEEVQPGFLQILDAKPAKITPSKGTRSSGRRIAFANILADPNNPLTARVMVNRIWQYHFGRGIVGTPSDVGVKGDRPSHPALLDWLAAEFVRNGWSVKKMHRLIMTSNTYRQSSRFDELAAKADPEDKLLWRFPRQRLEGEEVRDAALAVSGLLNWKMGGPSVFPELPPGMSPTYSGWKVSKEETERNRRSIYVFVKRNTRYPLFESFDMPDTHESCPRRNVTITPLQALNLLNSELTLRWAESFAARVIGFAGT